ncbi:MAG: glycoside hydrolase N-terminal domain-containing protein [Gemmatimonadota bacterium]
MNDRHRLVGLVGAFGLLFAGSSTRLPAQTPDPRSGLLLTAPIARWDEAIPIGNGTLGALLWGGDSTLILSLDRGDLWDERTPAIFSDADWNWSAMQRLVRTGNMARFHELFDDPYEKFPYPTKLPAGRIEITWPGHRIDRFELDLTTAEARAVAGKDVARVWALADRNVILISLPSEVEFRYVPPAGIERLEPTGPPRVVRAVTPTGATQSILAHILTATDTFSVAIDRVGRPGRPTLFVTIERGTLPVAGTEVTRELSRTIALGSISEGTKPHREWWKQYWETSSVTLPDSALQAHYDFVKYLYGSAARRGGAPIPLQGLWTADNGGLPPWKGDYHNDLNTQMTYLAAHVAGLDEPMLGWLDYLEARLPVFQTFAHDFYGVDGAVIPGVMTLSGKPMGGWGMYSLSPTNGAWVAWSFWRQWRMTRDPELLRDHSYPFVREIGTALAALLVPDSTGHMVLPLSSSPEFHDNSIEALLSPNSGYDQALLRWCFGALAEMATELGKLDEATKWRETRDALGPLLVDPATNALLVARDEPYSVSHRHFSHAMAIHPLGLLSPADSQITNATLDQISRYGTSQWTGYSFAWFAGMLARAGRADSALRYLTDYLAFTSRNGFHVNGDQSGRGLSDMTYRPFTLEGNFLAMDAIHEMLLRSDGTTITLFPATPDAWSDVSFTNLRADGGYVVSAERHNGRITAVIRSRDGKVWRVKDPVGGRVRP